MNQLRRVLSTFDLTMIAVGGTIGSGIFLTPSLIAEQLPSPWLIIAVWGFGGAVTLCGALTFAELGGMLPNAGGLYVYLSEGYGKIAGFLFGWAYLLVVNTGGIAALSLAFGTYFTYLVPMGESGIQVTAIIGLALVTILNIIGVKAGSIFSDVFTLLKLVGIGVLVIVGIGWGTRDPFAVPVGEIFSGDLSSALTIAMIGVLWSFGGWQHASFASAEAVNPTRSVPKAMIFGALIITTVYILANVAYLSLLSPGEMGSSQQVASDAMERSLGAAGGAFIAGVIFLSTFGSTGIYTLTVPRVYFAMARDGIFFRRVAETHPRFNTPVIAILLQSSWALVLILFWRTFGELISYVVFTDWVFFGLTGGAVFVLRRKRPDVQRPYRTIGYPVTPALFIGTSVWIVINTLVEQPLQAWIGIGFLALGVPVYYFWRSRNNGE